MSVRLGSPDPVSLYPVPGVELGVAEANIKKPNRKDLLVMRLAQGARVAAVFTSNRFCAAPVTLAKAHLENASVRALVVNTGNANAGTGEDGLGKALAVCQELADLLGCDATQVLPFSTGVILEPLPVERVLAGLPSCLADLRTNNWFAASHAIMTTDTVPKAASRQLAIGDTTVTITGISKGAGMIHPNMATMLGYIATDAAVSQALLNRLVSYVADRSFNRITVDGDTSTNDSFVLVASGQAGNAELRDEASPGFIALRDAITEIAVQLAQAIVRDGEGATKFITINVSGGGSAEECSQVAYAIGRSPLVKTAFFASDPNLGRILAAIGYAGIADLDVGRVKVYLDDVLVAEKGGRAGSYREEDGNRVMRKEEITIGVELNRGSFETTVWTCDFSYDYVKINAEYRS